jgi:hypothetical protein
MKRKFRMSDEALWKVSQRIAEVQNRPLSSIIVHLLEIYVDLNRTLVPEYWYLLKQSGEKKKDS